MLSSVAVPLHRAQLSVRIRRFKHRHDCLQQVLLLLLLPQRKCPRTLVADFQVVQVEVLAVWGQNLVTVVHSTYIRLIVTRFTH